MEILKGQAIKLILKLYSEATNQIKDASMRLLSKNNFEIYNFYTYRDRSENRCFCSIGISFLSNCMAVINSSCYSFVYYYIIHQYVHLSILK
jgi:hypothetical protein